MKFWQFSGFEAARDLVVMSFSAVFLLIFGLALPAIPIVMIFFSFSSEANQTHVQLWFLVLISSVVWGVYWSLKQVKQPNLREFLLIPVVVGLLVATFPPLAQ